MEKLIAKKNIANIDEYLQILRRSYSAVNQLKSQAIRVKYHKRATTAKTVLIGINELIDQLEHGRSLWMKDLGAKKIPIVVERKLKLVVNNETGGDYAK